MHVIVPLSTAIFGLIPKKPFIAVQDLPQSPVFSISSKLHLILLFALIGVAKSRLKPQSPVLSKLHVILASSIFYPNRRRKKPFIAGRA